MSSSAHPPWYRDKLVWFRIVELVVILSATYIAWRSLERNTEGILASSSTQLFFADTQLEKEEYEGADKPMWTIYSRPDTDDPTAYCQQLLAAIAKHSKSIAAIPNADQLNKKIEQFSLHRAVLSRGMWLGDCGKDGRANTGFLAWLYQGNTHPTERLKTGAER